MKKSILSTRDCRNAPEPPITLASDVSLLSAANLRPTTAVDVAFEHRVGIAGLEHDIGGFNRLLLLLILASVGLSSMATTDHRRVGSSRTKSR
jgi:hypothetical protein